VPTKQDNISRGLTKEGFHIADAEELAEM